MRPVDLRLMARPGLKALLLARCRPRPRALDVTADRGVAAPETLGPDQGPMNPPRPHPRRRGQPLIDQRLELVQHARHPLAPLDRLGAGLPDSASPSASPGPAAGRSRCTC